MQILDTVYVWDWCRTLGALDEDAVRSRVRPDPSLTHRSQVVFAPNGPTGYEPAVAASVVDALGTWDECLLWVTAWGIWPSSEDWPRYYAWRGRQGSRLSLEAAPGHLATREDEAEFREVVLQVLENGWDAWLLAARGGKLLPLRIRLSHDGWALMEASEPVVLNVPGLKTDTAPPHTIFRR
ncbi:hypothetical protein [Longimicrobium terrae]|uniref:Uncharacterized protein n=1 Tax=Longimicrobium terrae TaxID=1639882 RepID=A0A841H776_9BACT|nr:hypothetical protein [Longimicrobium terrae]MBB4639617.1 hypothetical protein [Longimicrobium terrae]MBB6073980.1 hypothetical protein [Longimicrobium terrae]NNC28300.1 hypothetical protein [Longimicrobium terrae]